MNNIIPIFYDHSSHKGILTFDKPDEVIEGGPDSIIALCKENDINKCYFISKTFHTFIQAWKNCKKENIQLIFGLELWVCDDTLERNENSLRNEHKIIIFTNNSDGYNDLIKIYTACKTDANNKYYKYRFDLKKIKPLWTNNLTLVLPFFDSFIARNLLSYGANIVPDFPCDPTLFREIDSGLPFHRLIDNALNQYNLNNKYEEVKTKTIFYSKKEDAKAWIIYRSIHNHSSYSKPELDFACSDNFSMEDYKILQK